MTLPPSDFVGLGKVQWNSSVCHLAVEGTNADPQVFLTERATRVKADGGWPVLGLLQALSGMNEKRQEALVIAENRDVQRPADFEDGLARRTPFYEQLRRLGLERFAARFNPGLSFLTHHHCHAMAATALSPFKRSLVLVLDGAGTRAGHFPEGHPESRWLPPRRDRTRRYEECSAYLQEGPRLRCVYKRWQRFREGRERAGYRGWTLSDGVGILYEEASKFIFGSIRDPGKVMGLAAFGRARPIADRRRFLESLDWDEAFSGKRPWDRSGRFASYADLAASVQDHFEGEVLDLLGALRRRHPDVPNLIFTGGCALNCIVNMKIVEGGLFDRVYVPPFPSDECIGFGAAFASYLGRRPSAWRLVSWDRQEGSFGPKSSRPSLRLVEEAFAGLPCHRPADIHGFAADLLAEGALIAWFQGRSESGPRALGRRSILSRIDVPGLKDRLNRDVKRREGFRPYGCSCVQEVASRYFHVPPDMESPFMSFAPRVRAAYRDLLREVTHADGTSRIQTVRPGQNPEFWRLLQRFGRKTGVYALLNTSLNVMGEPIVETPRDARRFLERTPVDGLVIGDLFVSRRPLKAVLAGLGRAARARGSCRGAGPSPR